MKVLIIDDDFSFVTELKMNLDRIGVRKTQTAATESAAIKTIVEFEPDFVICDINLGGENSGLVLSQFLASRKIPFIIVTQFKDEDLYDNIVNFQPLAYFIKPLDYIALKYTINNLSKDHIIAPSSGDLHSDTFGDYVFIRKKSKYEKVNYADIDYIEAEGNYITFHCQGNKFIVRSSLKKCLDRLSSDDFVQVHRNYIVNINRIKSYDFDKNQILVEDEILPVGRSFKSAFRKVLPLLK